MKFLILFKKELENYVFKDTNKLPLNEFHLFYKPSFFSLNS
jgi:hypothetical protein